MGFTLDIVPPLHPLNLLCSVNQKPPVGCPPDGEMDINCDRQYFCFEKCGALSPLNFEPEAGSAGVVM